MKSYLTNEKALSIAAPRHSVLLRIRLDAHVRAGHIKAATFIKRLTDLQVGELVRIVYDRVGGCWDSPDCVVLRRELVAWVQAQP